MPPPDYLITGIGPTGRTTCCLCWTRSCCASDSHRDPLCQAFATLRTSMGLEHTRHRSPVNALLYVLSCLAATTLAQSKVNRSTSATVPLPNPCPPSQTHPHLSRNWGSLTKNCRPPLKTETVYRPMQTRSTTELLIMRGQPMGGRLSDFRGAHLSNGLALGAPFAPAAFR